jgi:prepilin-type N-terminal cleavage/methylation domain-containing protein
MKKNLGFTLIELLVTIAIIAVISSIILFSVTQYINKSKDANIIGNLAVLVSAGEIFYNSNQSYNNFCISGAITNADSQMPENYIAGCSARAGICCADEEEEWAACAKLFSNAGDYAYCVDSRGVKKQIKLSENPCNGSFTQCPE